MNSIGNKGLLLALDMSVKNTGYCIFDIEFEALLKKGSVPCIPATRKAYKGMYRLSNDTKTDEYKSFDSQYAILDYISRKLLTEIEEYAKDIEWVIREGYSYGGSSLSKLAEAAGVCLTELWRGSIKLNNIISIPPQTLKKYATGKGKATKKEVQEGIFSKWEIPLSYWECDDESDSFVLGKIGVMYVKNNCITKYEKELVQRINKSLLC